MAPTLAAGQQVAQSCPQDQEPNNEPAAAMALAGELCIAGVLTQSDQDMFAWTVPPELDGRVWSIRLEALRGSQTKLQLFLQRLDAGVPPAPGTMLLTLVAEPETGKAAVDNVLIRPGTYFLGLSFSGSPEPYRLLASVAEERRVGEAEADPANPQEIGETPILGDSAEREDVYRWTVDAAGAKREWTLSLSTPIGDPGGLVLENEAGAALARLESGIGGPLTLQDVGLDPGSYIVRVPATRSSQPYRLQLVRGGPRNKRRESEPNDVLAAARPLLPASPVKGRLVRQGDVDMFTFDVAEGEAERRWEISMETDLVPRRVCLLDAAGAELQCREALQVRLPRLGLQPGRYAIAVSGRASLEASYDIALRPFGAGRPNTEFEPNDTVATAIPLHPETPVGGRLDARETDQYKVTISGPPQIWRIVVEGAGANNLRLRDARAEIAGVDVNPYIEHSAQLSDLYLVPGDYYISVAGGDADYVLAMAGMGPPDINAEREPNDADDRANKLHFGQTRTGRLSTVQDNDFYRFSLPAAAHVAVELVPPAAARIWMGLEWGSPSIRSPRGTAEGSPVVYDAWLEAGDYLIRLYAQTPSAEPYKLTLLHRDPYSLATDREHNSTFIEANPVPATLEVEGVVGDIGGDDWYALPRLSNATSLTISGEGKVGLRLQSPEGTNLPADLIEPVPGLRATIPPNQDVRLEVSGSGAYKLQLDFADGPRPAPPPEPLPVKVSLSLPDTPVSAYWIDGQELHGSVEFENTSATELSLNLDTSTTHFAVTAVLAETELRLAAGERRQIALRVRVSTDAWSDPNIQVSVRARTEDGGQATGSASFAAEPRADPVDEHVSFPIPEGLLGGFNIAAKPMGGVLDVPEGDPLAEPLGLLFDDLISTSGLQMPASNLPYDVTVSFGGGRSWPIAGILLHPKTTGTLAAEQLMEFELLLSADGTNFDAVLSGTLSTLPAEQAFLLDRPIEAQAARLRLISTHAHNVHYLVLGEWKVVAAPGALTRSELVLTDPDRGGHVARGDPLLTSRPEYATAMLDQGGEPPILDIVQELEPSWVIGFKDNRCAQVVALQWDDRTDRQGILRFSEVDVAVSTESPVGPWRRLGTWRLERDQDGVATWRLPEPVWARFVRFTTPERFAAGGKLAYPRTLRILERAGDETYRSILGEWGMMSSRAIFEQLTAPQANPVQAPDANDQIDAATVMPWDEEIAGDVEATEDVDWYAVDVPEDVERIALRVTGKPFLSATARLTDAAGAALPIRAVSVGPREALFEAVVPAGRYFVLVEEPPRSVGIAYDLSTSLGQFGGIVFYGINTFPEGMNPLAEAVNILPFDQGFVLPDWTGDPFVVQGALANAPGGTTSGLEATIITATEALALRPGAKAIIVITDAESTSPVELHGPLWRALEEVKPRIFAAHIGGSGDYLGYLRQKSIMQDLASVNGGHYASARTQAEMDVVFERAAAWLRRPARYVIKVGPSDFPPPEPGRIAIMEAGPESSQLAQAPRAAASPDRARPGPAIELILDASGSMLQRLEGRRRIEIARDVLIDLVSDTVPPGTPAALRVFGHTKPDSCDTELIAPLSPLDPDKMTGALRAVRSVNLARTPIAASLQAVASDLAGGEGPRTVVLVTDGEETCGGDPKSEIEKLTAQGFDVRVNIVGFAVADAGLRDTFRDWAAAGHGSYFDTQNTAELQSALEEAVAAPPLPAFRVLDPRGTVVATGIVGEAPVAVPAGLYRIEIDGGKPNLIDEVLVEEGQQRQFTWKRSDT